MQLIDAPSLIAAAGTPPKLIAEYVGRLNTGGSALSIAHMTSPRGWEEPGQTPEFDEYTVVLRGTLRVETRTRNRVVIQPPLQLLRNWVL